MAKGAVEMSTIFGQQWLLHNNYISITTCSLPGIWSSVSEIGTSLVIDPPFVSVSLSSSLLRFSESMKIRLIYIWTGYPRTKITLSGTSLTHETIQFILNDSLIFISWPSTFEDHTLLLALYFGSWERPFSTDLYCQFQIQGHTRSLPINRFPDVYSVSVTSTSSKVYSVISLIG